MENYMVIVEANEYKEIENILSSYSEVTSYRVFMGDGKILIGIATVPLVQKSAKTQLIDGITAKVRAVYPDKSVVVSRSNELICDIINYDNGRITAEELLGKY